MCVCVCVYVSVCHTDFPDHPLSPSRTAHTAQPIARVPPEIIAWPRAHPRRASRGHPTWTPDTRAGVSWKFC